MQLLVLRFSHFLLLQFVFQGIAEEGVHQINIGLTHSLLTV